MTFSRKRSDRTSRAKRAKDTGTQKQPRSENIFDHNAALGAARVRVGRGVGRRGEQVCPPPPRRLGDGAGDLRGARWADAANGSVAIILMGAY